MITLGALQVAQPIVGRLMELSLPINLSYKVNKLVKLIQPELEFYQTSFRNIIEDCVERDAEGKYTPTQEGIIIKPEKQDECKKRLEELNNIEVSQNVQLFTIEDIEKFDSIGFKLTFREMDLFLIFVA